MDESREDKTEKGDAMSVNAKKKKMGEGGSENEDGNGSTDERGKNEQETWTAEEEECTDAVDGGHAAVYSKGQD